MKDFKVTCTGCNVGDRSKNWADYILKASTDSRNSRLEFIRDVDNTADNRAIKVFARGHAFGMLGYLDKSNFDDVNYILDHDIPYHTRLEKVNCIGDKNIILLVECF